MAQEQRGPIGFLLIGPTIDQVRFLDDFEMVRDRYNNRAFIERLTSIYSVANGGSGERPEAAYYSSDDRVVIYVDDSALNERRLAHNPNTLARRILEEVLGDQFQSPFFQGYNSEPAYVPNGNVLVTYYPKHAYHDRFRDVVRRMREAHRRETQAVLAGSGVAGASAFNNIADIISMYAGVATVPQLPTSSTRRAREDDLDDR